MSVYSKHLSFWFQFAISTVMIGTALTFKVAFSYWRQCCQYTAIIYANAGFTAFFF